MHTGAGDGRVPSLIVPLKSIECGVYGDLLTVSGIQHSIYLRGTTVLRSDMASLCIAARSPRVDA